MEDREVAHLLDKSSPEVADLVVVGVGLSLALAGVLSQTEQYCDQAEIREDLMLLCLAAQNKILTVFLLVWLPIIIYCVIGNYKMETIPRSNTDRWVVVIHLHLHSTNIIKLCSQFNDIGQKIDVRNFRGLVSQNQFIDEQNDYDDYLLW